jgi:hypothetical protein
MIIFRRTNCSVMATDLTDVHLWRRGGGGVEDHNEMVFEGLGLPDVNIQMPYCKCGCRK